MQIKTLCKMLAVIIAMSCSSMVLAGENVGYDKGLYIKTSDDQFKMKMNIQLQPQYQYVSIEDQPDTQGFQIRRGRFVFSGHAFNEDLTYKFQFEAVSGRNSLVMEGPTGTFTGPNLREAFINYRVSDEFQVKGGQFKADYNREELSSSTSLQFVDRSILNEVFTQGYDLGLNFNGKLFDKRLEYAVYAMNEGNNRNAPNMNNEFLFGARVAYNLLGDHGYTMSDVKNTSDPQLVIGAAAVYNAPKRAGQNTVSAFSGDIAYRYKGFSALVEGDLGIDSTDDDTIYGFLGQVGYFLIPEKFEVAGRFAGVVPSGDFGNNGYEGTLGLNYFFKGHNVKLQTDYSALINSPLVFNATSAAGNFQTNGNAPGFRKTGLDSQVDHRFRTQVQLYF